MFDTLIFINIYGYKKLYADLYIVKHINNRQNLKQILKNFVTLID